MGVARVGRCETRARYECPGDRGILQQGSAAHDAWYHYIASAACSSLSCASSSSSTAQSTSPPMQSLHARPMGPRTQRAASPAPPYNLGDVAPLNVRKS